MSRIVIKIEIEEEQFHDFHSWIKHGIGECKEDLERNLEDFLLEYGIEDYEIDCLCED